MPRAAAIAAQAWVDETLKQSYQSPGRAASRPSRRGLRHRLQPC